jgi:hypothetical protein
LVDFHPPIAATNVFVASLNLFIKHLSERAYYMWQARISLPATPPGLGIVLADNPYFAAIGGILLVTIQTPRDAKK